MSQKPCKCKDQRGTDCDWCGGTGYIIDYPNKSFPVQTQKRIIPNLGNKANSNKLESQVPRNVRTSNSKYKLSPSKKTNHRSKNSSSNKPKFSIQEIIKQKNKEENKIQKAISLKEFFDIKEKALMPNILKEIVKDGKTYFICSHCKSNVLEKNFTRHSNICKPKKKNKK